MKYPKIRKCEVLNIPAGWFFSQGGFYVFLEKDSVYGFWNYTVSRKPFHPKERHFSESDVVYRIDNAKYKKMKDAAESALDWISRGGTE